MSFRSRTHTKPVVPVRRSSSLTRSNSATSASRPYYPNSSSSQLGYQNNYYSPYSSMDTYSPRNSGHFDYSTQKRRDSYGSNSSLNKYSSASPASTYRSPYKDRDRYNSGSNSYTSAYSNRYVSPYSTYENGVTTAGLSFHMSPSTSKSYTGASSNLSASGGGSNSSLYLSSSPNTHVTRSSSLREAERKSRSRSRKQASTASQTPTPRSLSASSRASEGYESGGEGRLDSEKGDTSENGEFIDYKALYEAEKAANDVLKGQLNKKDEEIGSLKAALDRFTNATTKNTLSEIEKRERRAMERKISELEEELKQLQKFKNENERLRAENRALTRVVSKLTTSAQNQLHHPK